MITDLRSSAAALLATISLALASTSAFAGTVGDSGTITNPEYTDGCHYSENTWDGCLAVCGSKNADGSSPKSCEYCVPNSQGPAEHHTLICALVLGNTLGNTAVPTVPAQ